MEQKKIQAGTEEYKKPEMEVVNFGDDDTIDTVTASSCEEGEYWGEEDIID